MKRHLILIIAATSLIAATDALTPTSSAPQVAKAYCDAVLRGDAAAATATLSAGSSPTAGEAAMKPGQLAGAAFTLEASRPGRDSVAIPYTLKGLAIEFPDHKCADNSF